MVRLPTSDGGDGCAAGSEGASQPGGGEGWAGSCTWGGGGGGTIIPIKDC